MDKEYWIQRQEQRLVQSELKGQVAISKLRVIYTEALFNINRSINRVYSSYSNITGLDVSELSRVLSGSERVEYVNEMRKLMARTGIVVPDIYNKKYLARLTRLEAIKRQIYNELQGVSKLEEVVTTESYQDIVDKAYTGLRSDLRAVGGLEGSFQTLDKQVVNAMLLDKWAGGNYSSRLWGNGQELSDRLQRDLGGALASGTGIEKVTQMLRKDFQVGQYKAVRLVRTEVNYFHNQAELQGYEDDLIDEYEYVSVLDGRTSSICRTLDNKVFRIKDARAGSNYPPLHPNCRSTTVPVIDLEKYKTQPLGQQGNDNTPYHTRTGLMDTEQGLDNAKELYLRSIGK